ncbi:MAG: hypothetical protein AAGB26_17835 [Planctomycetota bacterium]
MMGKRQQRASKFFYTGIDLGERLPHGHRLREIDRALSFERVRPMVAHRYGHNGHASLDPVVVLKLMPLLFIEGPRTKHVFCARFQVCHAWLGALGSLGLLV